MVPATKYNDPICKPMDVHRAAWDHIEINISIEVHMDSHTHGQWEAEQPRLKHQQAMYKGQCQRILKKALQSSTLTPPPGELNESTVFMASSPVLGILPL